MNSVVDEVLNTSATDNKIKYRITHADNTSEIVTIELETPIATAGTPLNKALFDSIQEDVTGLQNGKLDKSAIPTQQQAIEGIKNDLYMTPLRTQQKINSMTTTVSATSNNDTGLTTTLVDCTNVTNKIYSIIIKIYDRETSSSNNYIPKIYVNGTGIVAHYTDGTRSSGTQGIINIPHAVVVGNSHTTIAMVVDTTSKMIHGTMLHSADSTDLINAVDFNCTASTLTTIQLYIRGRNSTYYEQFDASIMCNK